MVVVVVVVVIVEKSMVMGREKGMMRVRMVRGMLLLLRRGRWSCWGMGGDVVWGFVIYIQGLEDVWGGEHGEK